MDNLALIWVYTLLLSVVTLNAKDLDLYCGACHALVEEIHWQINQTDPKKTIQVGSYRIMPDGTQQLNEVPYRQSGVHLTELLETACSKPGDYYQSTDKATNRKLYRRQNRRDGQPSSLTDVSISKESSKMLKFACESVAEDFEDEIMEAFKIKEDANYLMTICVTKTGLCSEDQLYDVNPEIAVLPDNKEDDKEDTESREEHKDSDVSRDENDNTDDDTTKTEL